MNTSPIRSTDRLQRDFDFAAHNAEQRAVWDAYHQRKPIRVPMILGTNTRYFMFNAGANPNGLTFKQYTEDPDVMFDAQLEFKRWSRFNLLQDAELGLPERWEIGIDFQNYYEAGWFGCPIEYMDDQVPDTHPVFADDPEAVMKNGLPDPFGGLFARAREYYEHFKARAERETYYDRPIRIGPFGLGTDGPFTVACNLFGPEFVCSAMVEDPDRLQALLGFITEANIARVRAWRELQGLPEKVNGGIADDSIALIGTEMYIEHVLPHHQRYMDALFTDKERGIHLCGDATRHFTTLRDRLGMQSFDTGFPIDFARMRQELGEDVNFNGGPHVELLLCASPAKVRQETVRILQTGIMAGGRFVLREGNNLAPYTPVENTDAMYEACRAIGKYGGVN